ncbi:MAG: response regulator transcription factor [Streptomycetaceae bacterium]|nr:response regulator transcription factor [Streptomycetaceae bacterium]
MARLLLVEDDAEIRRALIRALTERGHTVTSTPSGLAALQMVLDERPDLVVLDLGLPDVDGQQVLRMLRSVSAVPVIVATARDGEQAIVDALDLGADDFVHKPFGAVHLEARIRAVLRRGDTGRTREPIVVGDLRLDPATREVSLAGAPVELSPREFDLLAYLKRRPGEVVSKRELLAEVWHQPFASTDKTLDVHVSWLRRKLGEDARAPRYLHTVRGVGVRLTEPA